MGEVPRVHHWIDGHLWESQGAAEPVQAADAREGPVYDPATGAVRAEVDFASPEVVAAAVQAAGRAFERWGRATLTERMGVLFRFRELLNGAKEELASIITAEHGKVLSDAAGEVQRGLEVVEFACGNAHLLKGSYSEGVSTAVDVYSMRQPLGVVGIISPFNFPAMVPMWFFPIAIAAGNTVVLKPSEKDPSAAMYLAYLWRQAGLPDGVFNVVHGDRVAVDFLLTHPDVAAISFVGSTPIAKHVYETAASTGKRVQALGGAKNHMLVLPDADLDLAADSAVNAGFGSAGERCMAISVVVAVEPIADDLVQAIAKRMGGLRTGDGRRGCDMGPLVTRAHRDRVEGYVAAGEASGATLVVDGRDVQPDGDENGFWLGPTLFDNVEPSMSIYTDEIFGPVLSVVRVESYDEGMQLVSGHPLGNGTAIFTCDGGAARKFVSEVQAGMVGVNVPIPVPMAYYSFGGWKSSLFGDTHAHGVEGFSFYTRGKVVTSRWPDPARSQSLRRPERSAGGPPARPQPGGGGSEGGINLGFPTST